MSCDKPLNVLLSHVTYYIRYVDAHIVTLVHNTQTKTPPWSCDLLYQICTCPHRYFCPQYSDQDPALVMWLTISDMYTPTSLCLPTILRPRPHPGHVTYYIRYVDAHIVTLAHNTQTKTPPWFLEELHSEDVVDIFLLNLIVITEYGNRHCWWRLA